MLIEGPEEYLLDFYNLNKNQTGDFKYKNHNNVIYDAVVNYIEQLYESRRNDIMNTLQLFYLMMNTRKFCKNMILLLKVLVGNFILANADLDIETDSIRTSIEAEGMTVEDYVSSKVLNMKVPPPELVMRILPVILRIKIEIFSLKNNPGYKAQLILYKAELASYKHDLNDKLNFHDLKLSLCGEGEEKYTILYEKPIVSKELIVTDNRKLRKITKVIMF